MKRLTCEMCGSNDLVKRDGMFICQCCDTKYSVEEAKKMMIEGTVDVQGTVKVDNSDFIEKSLANARRAYAKRDWEETEKYYNLVEQHQPSNIEAIFYSAYAKACTTLIDADFYKKEAAFGILCRCVGIIDDNYDQSEREMVAKIGEDIRNLYSTDFVYATSRNGYGLLVQDDRNKTVNLFHKVGAEFVQSCLNIANKYPEDDKENRRYFYEIALSVAEVSCNSEYTMKIRKLAKPELTNQVKNIIITNEKELKHVSVYLTIKGVCERKLIPYGEITNIEVLPGEYECILYCDNYLKRRKTLRVPQDSRIDITYKILENGHNMRIS